MSEEHACGAAFLQELYDGKECAEKRAEELRLCLDEVTSKLRDAEMASDVLAKLADSLLKQVLELESAAGIKPFAGLEIKRNEEKHE